MPELTREREPVEAEAAPTNKPDKLLELVANAFEISWLLFFVLLLKDWLLSGVDFYPYAEAVALSLGVVGATWVVFGGSSKWLRGSSCPGMLQRRVLKILSAIVAVPAVGALLVILKDLPEIRPAMDTFLGLGFGSSTLSTTFITSVEPPTPVTVDNLTLGTLTMEQGLLFVLSLSALVLLAVVGTVRLCWARPESTRAVWVSLGGLCGVCVLLLCSTSAPAFLTLGTSLGTCILMACLGLIGAALQSSMSRTVDSSAKPARPRLTTSAHRRRQIVFTVIILFAGILVAIAERSLRTYVSAGLISAFRQSNAVPLSAVSQPMQDATVAMEDGHFYQHHGIDWAALHRAFRIDLRLGEVKQGGSTITQQLAKNVFLQDNDRSLWRKVEDIVLAGEVEQVQSKRHILEMYLNEIDYGMGQHGIQKASAYYFHQTPIQLTVPEAAILVGIVPDPMQEQVDLDRVQRGEQTALGRMAYFYPNTYSQAQVESAQAIPLDRLIYPDKDAWDRGATESVPATWHGVGFYFFAVPDEPSEINNVAPCLKERIAPFLVDARAHFNIIGIDHLGVYNDRTMRQSQTALSAHAYGQAIDISGFRFVGGRRVSVADHTNPTVAKQLAPLEALLKKHFDIVVDWHDDPLRHQTHFHCEVHGPREKDQRAPEVVPGGAVEQ